MTSRTVIWLLWDADIPPARYTATLSWIGSTGAANSWTTPLLVPIPGDANLDGAVDGQDFNIWNIHRFQRVTDWWTADFNGDDVTDVSDFNLWFANRFSSVDGIGKAAALAPQPNVVQRAPLPNNNVADVVMPRENNDRDGMWPDKITPLRFLRAADRLFARMFHVPPANFVRQSKTDVPRTDRRESRTLATGLPEPMSQEQRDSSTRDQFTFSSLADQILARWH